MKPTESIVPISYLKSHAAEAIRDVVDNQKTLIVTQNGRARVVVQDVHAYEETQERLNLLKLLAMSQKSRREGDFRPADEATDQLLQKLEER